MPHGRWLLILLVLALGPVAAARPTALPESLNAPAVGAKAPDFTLPDTDGKPVRLSKLLAPEATAKGNWILLVFYRGYW